MKTVELNNSERAVIVSALTRSLECVEKAIETVEDRRELDFLCETQETLCVVLGKLGIVTWTPNGKV